MTLSSAVTIINEKRGGGKGVGVVKYHEGGTLPARCRPVGCERRCFYELGSGGAPATAEGL